MPQRTPNMAAPNAPSTASGPPHATTHTANLKRSAKPRAAIARRALLWACLLIALPVGCVGTETGNPSFTGQLSYNTYSSQPAVAALRDSSGGITVKSAWLVLGDARFVNVESCNTPERSPVHVPGLGAGDHATPLAPSTPFELEPGRYCALRLPFLRTDAANMPGVPQRLEGHSVLLELTLADGTPATIESDFEGDVALTALDDAFEMDTAHANVLVAFDVATWLDGIGLDSAVRTGGEVIVNGEQNSDILAAFEARLAAGTGLFRDPTATGQVVPDSEIIAEGE